jgi:hypothetical protein
LKAIGKKNIQSTKRAKGKSDRGKKRVFAVILALLFVSGMFPVRVPAENPVTDLDRLDKACSVFGKPIPRAMRSISKIMDMDSEWRPVTTTTIEKRITFNDTVRQETILKAVKKTRNGKEKDVTQEIIEKGKNEKERKKDGNYSMSLNDRDLFVFSPGLRDRYVFSWRPDSLLDGRRVKRLLAVPKTDDEKRYIVDYCIHPDSLVVLSAEMKPSKNPKMVKSMMLNMRFVMDGQGRYLVKNFRMRFYVNLFIKKIRMEIDEEYGDFQF